MFFLVVLLMMHVLLLVVKFYFCDFGKKTGISVPPIVVGGDNRSLSSMPQSLFSVKDDISLFLNESSYFLNFSLILEAVLVR